MALFEPLSESDSVAFERWLKLKARLATAQVRFVRSRSRVLLGRDVLSALETQPNSQAAKANVLRSQADALEHTARAAAAVRFYRFRLARTLRDWDKGA